VQFETIITSRCCKLVRDQLPIRAGSTMPVARVIMCETAMAAPAPSSNPISAPAAAITAIWVQTHRKI